MSLPRRFVLPRQLVHDSDATPDETTLCFLPETLVLYAAAQSYWTTLFLLLLSCAAKVVSDEEVARARRMIVSNLSYTSISEMRNQKQLITL